MTKIKLESSYCKTYCNSNLPLNNISFNSGCYVTKITQYIFIYYIVSAGTVC